MSAKSWFKKTFGKSKVPTGPTAAELYSGPQAFSGYRPEAANVQANQPALQAAQGAMGQFQQMANEFGSRQGSPAQNAQMAAFLRQQQAASAGQRQAALQGAAARGTATGGAGLQAGLAGASSDANAAANAGAQLAGQAAQNRMAALGSAGQMGLSLNDAEMQRQMGNAQAADEFNRWAQEQQANARQVAYGNAQQAAADRRRIWERIGQAGTNFANSWVSNSGDD